MSCICAFYSFLTTYGNLGFTEQIKVSVWYHISSIELLIFHFLEYFLYFHNCAIFSLLFMYIVYFFQLKILTVIIILNCSSDISNSQGLFASISFDQFSLTSGFLLMGCVYMGFPGGSDSKASVFNEEYPGSIPGLGRSPGEENGNPLQYYCLENPMDGGV